MTGLAVIAWGEEAMLCSVVDALAHRGSTTVWRRSPWATGAMRCHGNDADVVADDGELLVFADARLHERNVLAALLGVAPTATDAELILHAYRTWGADCCRHIRGEYAFVVLEPVRKRVFCARDPFGTRPLYYLHDAHRLICASEPSALTRAAGVARRPELEQVALALGGWFNEANETFFAGIRSLGAGHNLTFTGGDARLRRHWKPDPWRQLEVGAEDGAALVRAAIERALDRRLSSSRPALFVSGGLDSAAMAGEVARQKRALNQEPPLLIHAAFPDTSDDETGYSDAVAQMWNLPRVNTRPLDEPARLFGRSPDLFWDPRLGMWEQLYAAGRERGLTEGLSGNGVDEVLRGTGEEWRDDLRIGRIGRVLRETGVVSRPWSMASWKRLLRGGIGVQAPSRPTFTVLTPRYQAVVEAHARQRDARHPRTAYPTGVARAVCSSYLEGDINASMTVQDRIAAHADFQVHDAFLDVDLVELLLSLPRDQRHVAGRDKPKPVFRAAVSHLVPREVLERERSGTYYHFVQRVIFDPEHGAAQRVFDGRNARLVDAGLVRPETIERISAGRHDPPPGTNLATWTFQARGLVSMEILLRQL